MYSFRSFRLIGFGILLASCAPKEKFPQIVVTNTLNIDRAFETVELTKDFLNIENLSEIRIMDPVTKEPVISQTVDLDGDSIHDKLIFQPKIKANSKNTYTIVPASQIGASDVETYCYSRFVPERTDDYAWENDRVAFRVFGPKAQKMVEDSIKGGTLTSGVDAWLKKVNYPIINKWYKKELETDGSYHEDTGEGLDNFHVGISRGVGGLAAKIDSAFYFSKNFINYRTITTGPIRTSFYLEYENWNAAGQIIKESKIISLDYGSNLSKFEISIDGVEEIAAGLTLHENDGEVTANQKNGWLSYWEPHGDSELGMAILAPVDHFNGVENYITEKKDLSNSYALLRVENNKVVYYAGFGWKESGQFNSKEEWQSYLNHYSMQINSPLKVALIN